MDIETAKSIQSLMNQLALQENRIKLIDDAKGRIKDVDGNPIGEIRIFDSFDAGFCTFNSWSLDLDYNEVIELIHYLLAYWEVKKNDTITEIEKL